MKLPTIYALLGFLLHLSVPAVRADVTMDFNTASTQLDNNFVLGNTTNTVYSSSGGAGGSGGMVVCSGGPSYFLYDPGTGSRTTATDTTANGVQSGNFTVGFDFRAGVVNDSFGVWFYDGATEGASRPSGNARLVLLNVNASGSSERVRWWTGGTAHNNTIGTAVRDINPTDTTVAVGTWYHAELSLVKSGTDLAATFTVWDQTKSTQYFTDTYTFTGVSQSGGQVAFRVNAASTTPPAIDYITLGAPPASGDPGTSGSSGGGGGAAGPGNPGGSIGGAVPATPAAPPVRNVERLFPAGTVINPTQSPYNADKTGATDATAAIQAALNAGSGRIVWLPNGTYKVSDTLRFVTTDGTNCRMIGQSRTGVVLQLANSAAGFGDNANPKPVLVTGLADSGNTSPNAFGRFVENLTIDTGSGNPGAIALHYYSNNYGAARDLVLRSGDGQGHTGLDLGRTRNNGPLLVQRVSVEGFDYGVTAGKEYGLGATLEHLTLVNQRLAGIYNQNQQLALRNVHTSGQLGPSLWNTVGHITLVEGNFVAAPAASAQPAVKNEASGQMLLRQVVSSGYAKCVEDPTHPVTAAFVNEWLSNASNYLFATQGRTLNLPVEDAPELAYDDPSTWVDLTAAPYNCKDSNLNNNYDNAAGIQSAIDSGATTLYVPAGVFLKVKSPVYLRGNVRRVIGLGGGAGIVGDGSMADNGTDPAVILASGTAPAVEWDFLHGAWGRALQFGSTSSRTFVIRDSAIQGGRFTGAGDLFFDGVCSNPYTGFTFSGGGDVFARQLNPECDSTKITVTNGTRLWLLGLKTEKPKTILDLSGRSKAEILGAFIYPIDSAASDTMWKISDARASLNFFEYLYGAAYGTLIQETQGGVARTIARGAPDYPAAYERATGAGFGSEMVLFTSADSLTGLSVRGNGVAIASGDTTPSTADVTDFGSAQVGNTFVEHTLEVQNVGDTTINFTSNPRVAVSGSNAGDFSVTADLPASLAAGQTAMMTLVFTPLASGARSASVSIAHDAAGSPFVFAVRGTGTAPAPIASFSPTRLHFAVAVGKTTTAGFSIVNDGYSPLTATFARNTGTTYFAARSNEPGGPQSDQWLTINSPSVLNELSNRDDYTSATFDLPFSFPYYGSNYSKARVCTNGVIMMTNTAAGAEWITSPTAYFSNSTIPSTRVQNSAHLFPYWDDLYYRTGASGLPDAKSIHGIVSGDASSYLISSENVSFWDSQNATKRFSFQTALGADGSVRFNYLTLAENNSYSVGIQQNSTTGLQLIENANGTPLVSGDSILFTPPSAWMTALSPSSGGTINVSARSSQAGSITVSGSGLTAGRTYRGLIRLSGTNDPNRPLVWLPVELLATATELEAWRYNQFDSVTATGDAADVADPDGDSMANLMEFALGSDPTSSASRPSVIAATAGNRLTLTFTPVVVSGLTYRVEASSDLADWSETTDVTPALVAGQSYTHTDNVALDSAPRRFLRLRVTAP